VETAQKYDFVVKATSALLAEEQAKRKTEDLKNGEFRVIFLTLTKRILMHTPKALKLIYG